MGSTEVRFPGLGWKVNISEVAFSIGKFDVLSAKNEINSKNFRQELLDKDIEILVEEIIGIEGEKYSVGHTKDYVRAAVKGEYDINELVCGKAVSFIREDMLLLIK